MAVTESRKKIAILGGGIAALAAAFELTEADQKHELYDITIYTMGWRLGGKGAVGRDPDRRQRGEEHGLHVWTGFYDNAFDLLQRCYSALENRPRGCEASEIPEALPFGSWHNAFRGTNHCTVMEKDVAGTWRPWRLEFPTNALTPGISDQPTSLINILARIVTWAHDHYAVSGLRDHVLSTRSGIGDDELDPLSRARAHVETLSPIHPHDAYIDGQALAQHIETARDELKSIEASLQAKRDLQHSRILLELGLTIAVGIIKDEVLLRGFDAIDDREWSEWMRRHGCSDASLESALVRGCYDYVFGYVKDERNVGAGTATRILLRLVFGYKGSFFYTMRATMGEIVFAPLYQVLRDRKVKFEFFHRVRALHVSGDGRTLERIDIGVQANVKDPPYRPLITIDAGAWGKLGTWPSHPLYDRLEKGANSRGGTIDLESAWAPWPAQGRTLVLSRDFDIAILAIGLGAFRDICAELIERIGTWQDMVDSVRTTPTMALQLWLRPHTDELGWPESGTVLTAFARPFSSWGDMSQLLELERSDGAVNSLAYFVGNFDEDGPAPPAGTDPDFPVRQYGRAKNQALKWMTQGLPLLWPGLRDARGNVRWECLFDPRNRRGSSRLDAQYLRVNVNPSDHYVLSVAGSVEKRMASDGSGIGNLYLAGDWVRTGINAGCVEAAVMAGRAAAQAITGVKMNIPGTSDLIGFDLPLGLLPVLNLLRTAGRGVAGGVGTIDACCAVTAMPADFVESLLPPRLRLIPQDGFKQHDRHPVVLVFAHQQQVRPGFVPFGGLDYHEFFELVPYVKHEDPGHLLPSPLSYMPYLLLDQFPPVVIGTSLYGFNKQLAQIRTKDDSFEIRSQLGRISAHFVTTGLPGGLSEFARMMNIRRMMELPLISQKSDGSFVYSVMDLGLDAATFQPMEATARIGKPFAKDDAESRKSRKIEPIDSDSGNLEVAFRLTTQWYLSLPVPSPTISGRPAPKDHGSFAAAYSQAVLGRLPFRRLG